MKLTFLLSVITSVAFIGLIMGCCNAAQHSTSGWDISCYSGGGIVYKGHSLEQPERIGSDGVAYIFKDAESKKNIITNAQCVFIQQ